MLKINDDDDDDVYRNIDMVTNVVNLSLIKFSLHFFHLIKDEDTVVTTRIKQRENSFT